MAAVREINNDPELLVLDVIDAREYSRCKDAYEIKDQEKRDVALEGYHDAVGEPKAVLKAVKENTIELFKERRPNQKFGQTKQSK